MVLRVSVVGVVEAKGGLGSILMTRRQRVAREGFWFIASGALALVRAAVELTEPVY